MNELLRPLVVRHTQRFYKTAAQTLQNTGDAEEAVQSAFLKFWQNPNAFDPSKSKFTTWFYRVVINQCRDQIKSRKSTDQKLTRYIEEAVATSPQCQHGEDDGLEHKQSILEQQIALEYAIARLSESQREVLSLVLYAQIPQAEAAEILGISLKALESILFRAKQRLAADISNFISTINQTAGTGSPCDYHASSLAPSTPTRSALIKVSK